MGLMTQEGFSTDAQSIIAENALETEGVSNWKALVNITHPKGLEWNYPELYESKIDPNFNPWELSQEQAKVPHEVLINEIEEGRLQSMEDVTRMQKRYEMMRKSYERTSYENPIANMVLSLPIEALNPVNYPELILAAYTGGTPFWARLGLGAAANSATAYASESQVQKNSGYIDYGMRETAAVWGAAIGSLAYGAFGKGPDKFKGKTNEEIEDMLLGTTDIDEKGVVQIYDRDKEGNFIIREATDDEIPEVGNKLALGLLGRMYASESKVIRRLAGALDVAGTTKGLVKGDTAQYIKELGMRNHMSTINDITGMWHSSKADSAGRKLTLEEFNTKLKTEFDKAQNGHSVSKGWEEPVARIQAWAKKEAEFRKKAGFEVLEDYTPRALDVSAIRNGNRQQVIEDFTAAMFSAADKGAAKQATRDLMEVKQRIIAMEQDLIAAGAKTRNTKVNGVTTPMLVKAHAPDALKSLYKQRTKLEKVSKSDAKMKKARKDAEKFVTSMENKHSNHSDIDSMKQRTYDYDESMVSKYMHQDMSQIVMHTANRTAGRIATQIKFGISSESDLAKAIASTREELIKEGVLSRRQIEKQLRHFEKSIKDLHGTLMHPKDSDATGQLIKRFVMNANFTTMGGGFFATALQGEAAIVLATGSLKAGLKGMGIGMREFRNLIRGMPMNSAYHRQLQMMSYAFDVTNHSAMGRFLDADFDPTTSRHAQGFEKAVLFSEGVAEKVGKWTGLTSITAGFRMAVAHTIIDDIFHSSIAKMAKNGDLKKFERLQISADQIKQAQKYKDKVFKYGDKGEILELDLGKLPTSLQNAIDRAVSNASRLNILSGDKKHLPGIFSRADDPLSQLILQFLSFPAQAYDSLLLKGVTENKAKVAVALGTGALFSSALAILKEESNVRMGILDDADRKYDISTTEGLENLGVNALRKGSIVSSLSLVADTVIPMVTGQRLGTNYRPGNTLFSLLGPSAGRAEDMFKTLQGLDFNPYDENSNAWKTVYGRTLMLNSFLPLYSLPMVGDVLRYWNKDMAGKL